MTNTQTDLIDLDPTEADLIDVEQDENDLPASGEDDYDFDFDSNYEDDRYSNDGVPSWSAWA